MSQSSKQAFDDQYGKVPSDPYAQLTEQDIEELNQWLNEVENEQRDESR